MKKYDRNVKNMKRLEVDKDHIEEEFNLKKNWYQYVNVKQKKTLLQKVYLTISNLNDCLKTWPQNI